MALDRESLRSQRLRRVNHQGDALRLGMNWTEEDLPSHRCSWRAPTAWGTRGHFISGR